jgi:hypothetical protein
MRAYNLAVLAASVLGAALFIAPVSAPVAHAQVVRGRLLDDRTERPVELANVFLIDAAGESRAAATTDSAGNFVLSAPAPGRYALFARRIGYRPDRSDPMELAAGQVIDVDFVIAVRPVQLTPVAVTEDRVRRSRSQWVAGLDVRSLGARLIPPKRIEALAGRAGTVADLIRWQNIPGLWVQEDPGGSLCVRLVRGRASMNSVGSLRAGGSRPSGNLESIQPGEVPTREDEHGCMAMYLDDVAFHHLEDVDPLSVDRILVLMPDEAGALYGTGSAKGVLLVYTKANVR